MDKEPATVIISGQDLITYMRLRQEGYTTQWVGEGKIALKKGGCSEK